MFGELQVLRKHLLVPCVIALSVLPAAAQTPLGVPELPGMKLAWNDEFDKDGPPDTEKWYSPWTARC